MACLSYPGWWLIGGTWSLKKKAKKKKKEKKILKLGKIVRAPNRPPAHESLL